MADFLKFLLFIINFLIVSVKADEEADVLSSKDFVFWPNATVPFYIMPQQFDQEQKLSIMTTLSLFAAKTCLKFIPVLAGPLADQHVMVFGNPKGLKKCVVENEPHSVDGPHLISLEYECLKSPDIDMTVMRALGFPFEHNRAIRDIYIDVQQENIWPGSIELYTKDHKLPMELRTLPYDINSVMHFGDRENSKNGHRTILIKNHETKQCRTGLTPLDIRKIELVYGPECRKRDRQEKIEICQNYPGVARRKREVEPVSEKKSLRVNPDITPPPEDVSLTDTLNSLGIDDDVQEIVEQVYAAASKALMQVKKTSCNNTKPDLRTNDEVLRNHSDVLAVVEAVARYAKSMVEKAKANLTEFCQVSNSKEAYQRAACPFYDQSRCVNTYFKSTKPGPVKWSTNHRPLIRQSTKHGGTGLKRQINAWLRSDNNTEAEKAESATEGKRDKRHVTNMRHALRIATKVVADRSKQFAPNYRVNNETARRKRSLDSVNGEASETVRTVMGVADEVMKEDLKGNGTEDGLISTGKDKEGSRRFDQGRRFHDKGQKDDSDVSIEVKSGRKKNKSPVRSIENEDIEDEKRSKKKGRKGKTREGKPRKKHSSGYKPKTVRLSKRNKEFYEDRRWPKGVVSYLISDNGQYDLTDMRKRLTEVNEILKEKTCVELHEIREAETNKYDDYIVLDDSPDYVTGRVGGKQLFGVIEMFEGGQHKQHTAMMVMAMLGFYFEVSRHDRDKYLRVHMRHVRPDKLHHFEKIRQDATLEIPYDYKSATQPAWQFWRKLGKTGISTVATFKDKDPEGKLMKSFGQNDELLSDLDLIKINSIYGIDCFESD